MDKTSPATSSDSKLPVQSNSTTSTNLQKIAPKPQIIKTSQGLVYIKNPNNTNQHIRIGVGGTSNTTAVAGNSGAIQIIKTAEGILQIKNKNVIAVSKPNVSSSVTTTLSTATSPNSTRFLLRGGSGGSRLVLAKPQTTKANVSFASSNTRTLTVSQAQQMGLITQSNLKELVPAGTASKTTTVVTSTADSKQSTGAVSSTIKIPTVTPVIPKTIQPTILNKGIKSEVTSTQKVLIQSASSGTSSANSGLIKSRPIVASAQNIIKLAPNSQVRAVNVAGKGVQYVRVLTSANATAQSITAAKVSVANGRQASMVVQRKLVPQTGQQAIASTGKPQHFVTKKLEVTPVTQAADSAIQMRPIKKEANPSKPLILNSENIFNTSSESKSNTSASSLDNKSANSKSFALNSPTSSPVSSPQKVIYRSYKLGDEPKCKSPVNQQATTLYSNLKLPSPEPLNAEIRRKHCNCTKSQCLKLYCDCFANGEFCFNCNCKECFNTLEHEDERQKAIKICLERNPHAFKPKIGKSRDQSDALRRHTKGCNCKRSGCLKNYCECYEAKIVCSGNCKCIGCRNIDDSFESQDRDSLNESNHKRSYSQCEDSTASQTAQNSTIPAKRACNFITSDVIEATIQCVIAQADDCQKNNYDARISERKILEEFGRCLVEIIDFSKKNNDSGEEE